MTTDTRACSRSTDLHRRRRPARPILNGADAAQAAAGEVHAIMGPNGSGKRHARTTCSPGRSWATTITARRASPYEGRGPR